MFTTVNSQTLCSQGVRIQQIAQWRRFRTAFPLWPDSHSGCSPLQTFHPSTCTAKCTYVYWAMAIANPWVPLWHKIKILTCYHCWAKGFDWNKIIFTCPLQHCYPGYHMRVARDISIHDSEDISLGPLFPKSSNFLFHISKLIKIWIKESQRCVHVAGHIQLLYFNSQFDLWLFPSKSVGTSEQRHMLLDLLVHPAGQFDDCKNSDLEGSKTGKNPHLGV